MSDSMSCAEIDGQHVELLPARTVLSLFSLDGGSDTVVAAACQSTTTGGPSGLVALLGLGAPANTAMVCVLGTVVANHGK
jgi:hypothetical protein